MLAFMGIEDYVAGYGMTRMGAKYKWNLGALYMTNPIIRRGDSFGCCAIVPSTTIAAKMNFMMYGGGLVKPITYDPDSYNILFGSRYHNDFVHTILAPKTLLEEFFGRPRYQIERESGLFVYARSNEPYYIAATGCVNIDNPTEQINAEHIAELLVGCMHKFSNNIDLIESYLSDM